MRQNLVFGDIDFFASKQRKFRFDMNVTVIRKSTINVLFISICFDKIRKMVIQINKQ